MNENRPKKPPTRTGFITVWSEKRQCWCFVPKSTPAMVKRREQGKQYAPPTNKRKVEKWSVEFEWQDRKKIVKPIKVVETYSSVTECAATNNTTRERVQKIAGGVWGYQTQIIDGKPYTYRYVDGKQSTKKVTARVKRRAKRAYKKSKQQNDTA